jgi:hypothetical protein
VGASVVLLYGVAQLPADWDTLAYHLPIIDHWIQNRTFSNQQSSFWYVPGNSELISFLFTAPFSGNYWAQFANLAVAILLGFATVALMNELGLSSFWAQVALVIVISGQPVIHQLPTGENDISVGALFTCAVLFGLRAVRGQQTFDATIFGIAVGLLAGTKYYAIGYSSVAITVSVALSILCVRRRAFFLVVVSSTIGLLLFCIPWYLRNYIIAGSPVFPLGFESLGVTDHWNSMRAGVFESSILTGGSFQVWWLLTRAWLFQWNVAVLIATATSPLMTFVILAIGRGSLKSQYLALTLLGTLVVYAVTPNVIETVSGTKNMLHFQYHSVRLGIAFGLASIWGSCYCLNYFSYRLARARMRKSHTTLLIAATSVCVLSVIQHVLPFCGLRDVYLNYGVAVWREPSLEYSPWLTIGAILTMTVLLTIVHRVRCLPGGICARTLCLFTAVFVVSTPLLEKNWHRNFERHYTSILHRSIDSVTCNYAGKEGICMCDSRPYAAHGSNRNHRAFSPVRLATKSELDHYLTKNDLSWIVVSTAENEWSSRSPHLIKWLRFQPFKFRKIHEEDSYELYRVNNIQNGSSRD